MVPTADKTVFLDTNILVYASFAGSPLHELTRARLKNLETDGAILWTSRQVLREFLAVATRPGTVAPAPAPAALEQLVRQFEATFQIADENAGVTALLVDLLMSHSVRGKQIQHGRLRKAHAGYPHPAVGRLINSAAPAAASFRGSAPGGAGFPGLLRTRFGFHRRFRD